MPDTETPPPASDTSTALTRAEAVALRRRLIVNVVFHAVLFALSLLLAYLVWFDTGPRAEGQPYTCNECKAVLRLLPQVAEKLPRLGDGLACPVCGRGVMRPGGTWLANFAVCLPFFVLAKLAIFGRMKLLRGGWRFASLPDVTNILVACWLFALLAFGLIFLFHLVPDWLHRGPTGLGTYFVKFSKGVLVLDFVATVFLVCTARLGYRLYREQMRPVSAEGVRRVLLVGAGDAAETILREIGRMRVERYRVVGLVDDDPAKRGLSIHGAPVLGDTTRLREICLRREVDEIIIAIPSATQKQLRRVIELCTGTKLKFQSLPSLGDLIDGRVTVSQIRPVDINDLLGREAVKLDTGAVGRFLRGRRVLITGAGGSIGSEMCRQVCRYEPARLVLVEQAETALFEIEGELRATWGEIGISACICDIYDRQRVAAVWREHRPEVVVHAAAHKHVPLMERDPSEAIKNNILGTRNVADASCEFGAAEFVMISTDKAVNPSSVMGASKRVAEIYTQALGGRADCPTQFKAVRFGNVLGSAGSVVPIFRRQIAAGGPVQVTHPDMVRYFMTIPEAAQLVLQAAATGAGGQIYILDMGEPVRIVDLARQMITLSGFRPDEDIEPTVHPKVLVWQSRPADWSAVRQTIAEMTDLRNCPDRAAILAALHNAVPEYTPAAPGLLTSVKQERAEGPPSGIPASLPPGPAPTAAASGGDEAVQPACRQAGHRR